MSNNLLKGVAAASGISIGTAYLYEKKIEVINDEVITDVDESIEKFDRALEKSKKELKKIFDLAVVKMGEARAGIFEAQLIIFNRYN